MEQCSDIFKANEDADLLQTLRSAGQSGERNRVDEISVKFQEHAEQLQEVWHWTQTVSVILKPFFVRRTYKKTYIPWRLWSAQVWKETASITIETNSPAWLWQWFPAFRIESNCGATRYLTSRTLVAVISRVILLSPFFRRVNCYAT